MPRKSPPETPLYVRLPASAGAKLDRAADALGVHKKDLVAGLVTRYVDPDSAPGLRALGTLSQPRRGADQPAVDERPIMGSYSFQTYDPPEVLSVDQAAAFLQIDRKLVVQLAEAGTLPGRKLGPTWRFARAALVAWLGTPERR